ncbi:hypothetical protein NPX13_g3000 [Xylaria arbuscula]|uniref:Major facilitator superfamily (MFS) profile domain-containing protein n=1 Tax=Xylaria arbuscula TaxID=114810 RepID=A0A9W8TN83_9PEZI|nr:hypothetical protein NPX13_g3000 [Xylaria arbuscula]
MTDFPREAKWLSPEERAFVLAKTGADESHNVPVTLRDLLNFLSKPIHWVGGMMYLTLAIPAQTFGFFLPTIVQALGYGPVETQLHAVPPAAAGLGYALVIAYLSDKLRVRSILVFLSLAILVTGLSLLTAIHGASSEFPTEYAALCLMGMGIFGSATIIVCWWVMNLRGHAERAIGSAWQISLGSIGGIIAAFTFKSDKGFYHTGYSISLALSLACVVACASYTILIWRRRKAEAGSREVGGIKHDPLWL